MGASRIDRINELYYKSQVVGLTEGEKEKQARLRQEYVVVIRGSFRNNLNNISIKGPDDSIMDLGKEYGGIRGAWCIVKGRL